MITKKRIIEFNGKASYELKCRLLMVVYRRKRRGHDKLVFSRRAAIAFSERLGLIDDAPKTNKEVGEILHISAGRSQQLFKKCMRTIRSPWILREFEDLKDSDEFIKLSQGGK